MPAAHTDAARPHTNQPCCYCVSIVRWIRSVCFFRTWTCGQETVNVHGKGAGRHPRLNSTGDPFLTGLPCSGTVNSLTQLWNAPSVSSQGKLYICLAHPRVLRVPTVLLIQTRAPIVIFARAHPDSSVSPSVLPEASPCGGVLQMRRLPRRLGIQQPHVRERGAAAGNQAPTGASFITWVLCRLQVQPPGNSIPGPARHRKQSSVPHVMFMKIHPLFLPE